jgi:hypothetical protein
MERKGKGGEGDEGCPLFSDDVALRDSLVLAINSVEEGPPPPMEYRKEAQGWARLIPFRKSRDVQSRPQMYDMDRPGPTLIILIVLMCST